jgi:[ribosomal protein S5]-alanine N-acetyltransferase
MNLPISQYVSFREFRESDWMAVHRYAGNFDNVQYMDWGPNTEEDTQAFTFAVIDPLLELLIGTAAIRIQDTQTLVADFGYILHSDYWGRGYGTEIAKAMVRFGFEQLGMHRIWATCRPQNIASSRVLEKAGLKYERYLKEHKKIRGSWVDSCLYTITRADFNLNPYEEC